MSGEGIPGSFPAENAPCCRPELRSTQTHPPSSPRRYEVARYCLVCWKRIYAEGTTLCELLPPLLNRNKGMQLIDSCVSFLEVKVVTIRYARIIAHPLADFRQALSGDRKKRAKRMAHDMWRDPRKILRELSTHEFQIEIERANEIVAISTLPALDFRRDAPPSVHKVFFQERDKDIRQWNRSGFTVLRSKGFRLLHPKRTASDRKPRWTRLDNFVTAQPCFKSRVHDTNPIMRAWSFDLILAGNFCQPARRASRSSGWQYSAFVP